MKPAYGAWCPECGPLLRVDEDGCCLGCGNGAMGPGASRALRLLKRAAAAKLFKQRIRRALECLARDFAPTGNDIERARLALEGKTDPVRKGRKR